MADRVREQYRHLLDSEHLQPYVGHTEEWELVERVRVAEPAQVCALSSFQHCLVLPGASAVCVCVGWGCVRAHVFVRA